MRRTALITQAHTHDQANCQWDDVSVRSNPLEEQIDPSALTCTAHALVRIKRHNRSRSSDLVRLGSINISFAYSYTRLTRTM